MMLPDLFEVQSDRSFHIEGCVHRDEVHLLGDAVNDYHDHVIGMHLRKLNNEVDTNDVPSVCWSLCRVEFSIESMVLQLSLIV
jgi:hypothetical protein